MENYTAFGFKLNAKKTLNFPTYQKKIAAERNANSNWQGEKNSKSI